MPVQRQRPTVSIAHCERIVLKKHLESLKKYENFDFKYS